MSDDVIDFVGDEDEPDTAVRLYNAIEQARALDLTDDHRISVPIGEMSEVLEELMTLRKDIRGNQVELLKEDLECVHRYLDYLHAPREGPEGTFSVVGRLKVLGITEPPELRKARIITSAAELGAIPDYPATKEIDALRTAVASIVIELHQRGDECRCQSVLSQLIGLTRYGADCTEVS